MNEEKKKKTKENTDISSTPWEWEKVLKFIILK